MSAPSVSAVASRGRGARTIRLSAPSLSAVASRGGGANGPAERAVAGSRGVARAWRANRENRPCSYRSSELVFATYLSAGVRVYDLADPDSPVEIAHWLPRRRRDSAPSSSTAPSSTPTAMYVTDRVGGGLSILEPAPALAERMSQAASQ